MKRYTNLDELPITLSVMDVAAILGISRISAYNLCHAVDFPSIRIGKRILIPKSSFQQWLESRTDTVA